MDLEASVTQWIDGLRQGDEGSAEQLWKRYFQQLVRLAGKRLPSNIRRTFDEEDIALSAFHSLCEGVQNGKFPALEDRENLWSLLVVITARKAIHTVRDATAQKRGGGNVGGESALAGLNDNGTEQGIHAIIGREPTPEFAARLAEQSEELLTALPDEPMRQLALLKLEGSTNQEAAQRLDCSVRTIERRLRLIRKIWSNPSAANKSP